MDSTSFLAGIEVAVRHRTLCDKKSYMSGTYMSKRDILSCTLSLSVYVENPLS